MKAYGIPRNPELEHPDVSDIQKYGMKSCAGRFKEKGGDFKSYTRKSSSKRAVRRHWKKQARKQGREECCNNI